MGPMFKYDNAYMKLGMGDPCAGHKGVIATYWTCFVIEKESISEKNLGFDPPTGTDCNVAFKRILFHQRPPEMQGWSPCKNPTVPKWSISI